MLKINNSVSFANDINFKGGEKRFAVKIGGKLMPADEYFNRIEFDILANKELNYFKTYNYAKKQIENFAYKCEKEIYEKVIQRCFDDIDSAILKNEPSENIAKLHEILETFIKKFGY